MKRLIPLFLVVFLIPQVALAAWWNPISWFEEKPAKVENKAEAEIDSENKVESTKETEIKQKPIIQEKIIEKTIQVDNPELQKKINSLLQENTNLQLRINSLTSELNACKMTTVENTKTIESEYSDFEFKVTFSNDTLYIPDTYREIILKKAVFNTDDPRNVLSVSVETKILEKQGDSTFIYIGGIRISRYLKFNVQHGGSSDVGKITPDFSKWEIWDGTTNKPVKIKYN